MFRLARAVFRTGEVISRVCLQGEGEAKVPSFLAESTNNSHVSFESMDKTEDGQTIERTHDPRTTSDRVPLIPLPLRVAELLDMYERAGTTRTYTELHAIRIVCLFPVRQKLGDLIPKPVFFYPSPSTTCKAHTP